MEIIQKVIATTIDNNRDRLNNIGKEIWNKPEASFKEVHAHKLLTDFLVEEGFEVERNYTTPTGFKAVYTGKLGGEGDSVGPTACLLCEYDAVADVGHAAGHNLKSESTVAAALALKQALKDGSLKGTVMVLGSSGEDSGCGTKINMVQNNTFHNVDFCMMLNPLNHNILAPTFYCLIIVNVEYKGKSTHASAHPWDGRNALDAAISCCNNISMLRQQLKPTMSINGVILSGGRYPNVIPDHSELQYWLRAVDHMDLFLLKQKCTACFVAAAKATGCEVDFTFNDKAYSPMIHNPTLLDVFSKYAEEAGMEFCKDPSIIQTQAGSTDMGNVSEVVPSICPAFAVGTNHVINSLSFTEDCGSPEAHEQSLVAAKAMACTAAEVMLNPDILQAAKKQLGERTCAQVVHRLSGMLLAKPHTP